MIVDRQAARAILLTPTHQILLLRIRPPQGGEWFWIAPGGGINAGETVEAGLRRELREEVGLDQFALGPLVWKRQHTFDWGEQRIRQREEYYVVHVDRFEPCMSDTTELMVLDRFQWWPVAELAGAVERVTPLCLADIVAKYLAEGPPRRPLAVEVLVD
jgi:8-oxo-dGTP pyrophosphatase MutT (NUDIX family)